MPEKECAVCLVEHDEEVHEATLRLREWHRQLVMRYWRDEMEAKAAPNAA